jgi:hypothetical protein
MLGQGSSTRRHCTGSSGGGQGLRCQAFEGCMENYRIEPAAAMKQLKSNSLVRIMVWPRCLSRDAIVIKQILFGK